MTLLSSGLVGWQGTVTANGRVAVLSTIGSGTNPGIKILGRKEGTHSNASLTGLYHLSAFAYNHGGMNDLAYWGSVTFDGVGGGPGSATTNRDGGLIGPIGFTFPYSVAADGTVTGDFGNQPMTGSIIAGGEVVIMAGGTTAGLSPLFMVLTKGTTGATNALLSGTYRLAAMIMPTLQPPEWHGVTLTGTADGAGLFGFTGGWQNQDGVATAIPAGGDSAFSVGPNGLFDFSGSNYFGGITPPGDFAVFAGQISGAPEFWFMLR